MWAEGTLSYLGESNLSVNFQVEMQEPVQLLSILRQWAGFKALGALTSLSAGSCVPNREFSPWLC